MYKISSIDALLTKGKIPQPNFMKTDIEGAELLALEGAKSTTLEHRPTIFLVTHSTGIRVACCELLNTLGYGIDLICGDNIAKTDSYMHTWTSHECRVRRIKVFYRTLGDSVRSPSFR